MVVDHHHGHAPFPQGGGDGLAGDAEPEHDSRPQWPVSGGRATGARHGGLHQSMVPGRLTKSA